MVYRAEIRIELKKGILDAEANTVQKSLDLLGFKGVKGVKTAKIYEISLNSNNRAEAEKEIEQMCERLLANPVINNYTIKLSES